IQKLRAHFRGRTGRRGANVEMSATIADCKDTGHASSAEEEVCESVFINIAYRNADEFPANVQSNFLSHVAETSVAHVAEKLRLRVVVHNEQVNISTIVEIRWDYSHSMTVRAFHFRSVRDVRESS